MMNLLLPFLALMLTPTFAADASLLIGRWTLPESESARFSCSFGELEYIANGTMVSRSGRNISSASYKLAPHKEGFLLKHVEISNNEKSNCQGLSSEFVRKHTPQVIYIEVSSSELKVFQLENKVVPIVTLVRFRP